MFNTLPSNVSLTPDFSADAGLIALTANNSCIGAGLDAMLNFALYQGRYSANNFSRAPSPLMLDPPVGMGCSNMLGVTSYLHLVVFAPKSDNATMSPVPSAAEKATTQTDEMQLSPATGSCSGSPYRFNGTTVENQSTTTSSGTAIGYGCYVFGTGTAGLNGYWTAPVNGSDVQIDTRTNSSEYASFAALGTYFHQFSPGAYTLVAEDLWNQTVFAHFEVVPPEPVEVLSVTGPIPPTNPGGPVVKVDVKNTGDTPIVYLNASLSFVPPMNLPAKPMLPYQYSFFLGVNASHPLLPGHNAVETRTLIGAGFDIGTIYPLRISGTFANGTEFSYVLDVQLSTP